MDHNAPSPVSLAGQRAHNERYGSYIQGRREWRLMAMFLAATTAISTSWAVWRSSQSTVTPYIVQENALGETGQVFQIVPSRPPNVNEIRSRIARWVVDTRSVFGDKLAETNIAREALDMTDDKSQAVKELDYWFRAPGPLKRSEKDTVGVFIENVAQKGGSHYSADFWEDHYTHDGQPPTRLWWRLECEIAVHPPKTDKEVIANPFGIYVTWFHFSPRTPSVVGEVK
jgi:type IV secretory pathway TrbF-like protein